MVRGGRDMRFWIAVAFGLDPRILVCERAAGDGPAAPAHSDWSLASFELGVELAQILTILTVGAGIATLRRRSPEVARRLVYVGSAAVDRRRGFIWFVQRVFFPGGIV